MQSDYSYGGLLVILFIGVWIYQDNKTEGVYEDNYIICERPEGGDKWRALFDRDSAWAAIQEQEYQVSFANQRVIAHPADALTDCSVFNRNNWQCQNEAVTD